MKLRCIVIDDEYLARQRLLNLLGNFDFIEVVGECKNGKEALEKVYVKEPDLIFLDIQMPGMDGFAVLDKLQKKPFVIFTTAFDKYALNAFEINAIDYLLKPFDEERLAIAIERILDRKKSKKALQFEEKIKNLMVSIEDGTSTLLKQISIKNKGKVSVVNVEDVIYFKSDGNYVHIISENDGGHLFRSTISSLNEQLDKSHFLRIHRALIVNKIYIKKCTYINNNVYKFTLKNGIDLTSSRSFSKQILAYLSNE